MVWYSSSGNRAALTERKCTKHVVASKRYKNKLVILSGMELVFMSACLQDYNHRILNVNQIHQGKPCFSKLKYHQFLNC